VREEGEKRRDRRVAEMTVLGRRDSTTTAREGLRARARKQHAVANNDCT